ncbi:site-specific integrase [Corynebacterium diphtheriae]|nr:site-specific integrase [Corynebacterium diphtheriae]CAB0661701.1 site-specific integrase [Corynebacterium diphtheriae]
MAVQKRTLKNGKTTFIARWRDPHGKQHSKSFEKQRDAKKFVADREHEVHHGTWIDPKLQELTVGDLVADYVELATKPGTKRDREILQANLGDLRDMKITTVRQSHIEAWAVQLRDGRPWAHGQPLAATTVKVKTGQMRTVLQRATDDGLINRNPAVVLKRFDVGHKDEPFYLPTPAEVNALYTAAKNGPKWFRLALRLGAEAGLRAGEVCGLRVKDVDFMRKVIHVRVQSVPGTSGEAVAPLKTWHSRRDVPISESLAMDLSTVLVGRDAGLDDRLLVGDWGRALFSSRVSHVMANMRRMAGVSSRVHFHSLRHLFASRLLAAGVDLPTVSGLLGHANVAVTARVYAHQIPGREDVARNAIARLEGFVGDSVPSGGAESV